jgi:hypothetical protein
MIYIAYLFNIQPVCLLSIVHQGTSFISILHIYSGDQYSSNIYYQIFPILAVKRTPGYPFYFNTSYLYSGDQ